MASSSNGKPPPRRSYLFSNPDKAGHKRSADPALPGWPWRLFLSGRPGSGKRNVLLGLIARHCELKEGPDRILVLHLDGSTTEYDILAKMCGVSVEVHGLGDPTGLPTFEDLEGGDVRTLVIIDEIPLKSLRKDDKANIGRILNYGSTHRNTSVALVYQSFSGVTPEARRACQHYVLFKNSDLRDLNEIAAKIGMEGSELREIQRDVLPGQHDSLWVDTTAGESSPWRFRRDIYHPVVAGPDGWTIQGKLLPLVKYKPPRRKRGKGADETEGATPPPALARVIRPGQPDPPPADTPPPYRAVRL